MSVVANFTASPIKTICLRELNKLFEVLEIRGMKVFAWSLLLIGAVILLGALEEPLPAVTDLRAYFGIF
jgi:hypothetical protein